MSAGTRKADMGGMIIDPAVLADIRAQCQRRAAELGQSPPATVTEAERFAASVPEMPARVRAFFEREESPYIPMHRRETVLEVEQRLLRESFGGWCG
jgi:hypothetical protein